MQITWSVGFNRARTLLSAWASFSRPIAIQELGVMAAAKLDVAHVLPIKKIPRTKCAGYSQGVGGLPHDATSREGKAAGKRGSVVGTGDRHGIRDVRLQWVGRIGHGFERRELLVRIIR